MYNRLTLAESNGGGNPPAKVDNKVRQDWNDYVDFLEKRGLKGSPSLDHNDLGFKMIEEYRKENPQTSITKDMIVPIQKEFSKYRDYALNQVDQGKVILGNGVTKQNFLSALSQVDGIPGQRTTSYKFPSGFMKDMDTNEVQNKGFMTSDKAAIDQITSK